MGCNPKFEVREGGLEFWITGNVEGCSYLELLRLVKEKVVVEVDNAALAEAVKGKVPVLVARGTPPIDGKDGYVILEEKVFGKAQEGTEDLLKVDFKEVFCTKSVKEDTLLATIVLPTKGKEGIDVFGNPIRPKPGSMPKLKYDKKTVKEKIDVAKGRVYLYSAVAGLPKVEGGVLKVDPCLVLPSVSYASGNVYFEGTVIVRGDVKPDFKVEATGDIVVQGVAEACTIVSKRGSVLVGGGIAGKGKAKVQAADFLICGYVTEASIEASYVYCRYVQSSVIKAKGVVAVSQDGYILNSKVSAGGVVAGEVGTKGKGVTALFLPQDGFVAVERRIHAPVELNFGGLRKAVQEDTDGPVFISVGETPEGSKDILFSSSGERVKRERDKIERAKREKESRLRRV